MIRANSAIMKCKIPSFVSEFIYVDRWMADDGTIYSPENRDYGNSTRIRKLFMTHTAFVDYP